jgi:hypothetical protein
MRSERERAPLAVVAHRGSDAGLGVAAGLSTYLHWLPCRGSMLRGSIVHDYDYDDEGSSFSDLCLRRMDGDQGPWGLALYVLAMVLAGVAWLCDHHVAGRCVRLTPLGPWCSNPSGRSKDSRLFRTVLRFRK